MTVRPYGRRDQLTGWQRRAIMNRHDPNVVVVRRTLCGRTITRTRHTVPTDHDRLEAVHAAQLLLPLADRLAFLRFLNLRQCEDIVVGDDHEQRWIDGVDTFTQDRSLTTSLSARHLIAETMHKLRGAVIGVVFLQEARRDGRRQARFEERDRILQVVARDDTAECLTRRKRLSVASVHVTDLTLRDRHQPRLVDAELPAPVAEMQSTAQQPRLITRLTIESDDPALTQRPLARPQLLDHADSIVRDVSHAQPQQEQHKRRADPQQRPNAGIHQPMRHLVQRETTEQNLSQLLHRRNQNKFHSSNLLRVQLHSIRGGVLKRTWGRFAICLRDEASRRTRPQHVTELCTRPKARGRADYKSAPHGQDAAYQESVAQSFFSRGCPFKLGPRPHVATGLRG